MKTIKDLEGHFIRGVLYDGVYIYLVEANKRVFQLCVTSTRFSDDFIERFGSVENSHVLSEASIENVELMPPTRMFEPIDMMIQIILIKTSRGQCELQVYFSTNDQDVDIVVRNYVGEPPKDIRRLTDF